jgi:hypothetical protein
MTETTPGQTVPTEPQVFPGWWPWVLVALAFPVAGYIGWGVSGHVDAAGAALIGGAITGAGLGLGEWLVAKDAFGPAPPWIAASAVAYAVGLLVGAALVDYGTDLGDLALMGAISGAVLGAAQGLCLAAQGRTRLAGAWAAAMPVLFALGWCASTGIGVDVDEQFTVFGAAGAIVFALLSGLVLAHFGSQPPQRRET